MSNVRIELNSAGIDALLHSAEIDSALRQAAQTVKGRAGDDFEVSSVRMPTRNIVVVQTANERGEKQNRDDNTLLKATFGGGEND